MSGGRTISCYVTNQLFERIETRIELEGTTRNQFMIAALEGALDCLETTPSASRSQACVRKLGLTAEQALANVKVGESQRDARIQKILNERKKQESQTGENS